MRIFEQENYYNIINGYKDLFLVKNDKSPNVEPEKYLSNTTIEEIYALFTLDRELRNIFLKYLLMFENSVKTKVAYRFSEKYKEPHAYLELQNYSKRQINKSLTLIAIISNVIKNKSNDRYNNPIKHYLNKHRHVPLWVLVNDLTLGNISNFYQSLNESLKDKIAKDFSIQFKRDYRIKKQIPKNSIIDVLKISNLIRNICAHEERLYNFQLKKRTRIRHNSNLLGIPKDKLNGDLFTLLALLKLVLPRAEHQKLVKLLKRLFDSYRLSFNVITSKEVLEIMGFSEDWEEYF